MAPHGSLYLQVHGIGSLVVSSFPELDKQGGNLTVESILRGIRFAAKQRKVRRFSTIYLQLDNTGSNKCEVVIVVMKLRAQDLPILYSRVDVSFSALKNEEAKIRFVEEAMGITDYEKGQSDILFPLPGIMAVKEIRITADHDGAPSTEY